MPALACCSMGSGAQMHRQGVTSNYFNLTCYSQQFTDAFSARYNQASVAGLTRFSIGAFAERRFMMQELGVYTVSMVQPTGSGNFALHLNHTGDGYYRETGVGLGHARQLGEKLALGLQFNYQSVAVADYGTASFLGFDAALRVKVTDKLSTGFQFSKPAAWTNSGEERLATVYRIGMGYDVSPKLYMGTAFEKTEDQDVDILAGVQYNFHEKFLARLGLITPTSGYYLGFGVQLQHLRLHVTASVHPYLGTTPGMLALYTTK